jgi:hypothetical protein
MNPPLYVNCRPAERAPQTTSLTFPAILSDPLVRLVMKADGVDPNALERSLSDIAANLVPHTPAMPDTARVCAW